MDILNQDSKNIFIFKIFEYHQRQVLWSVSDIIAVSLVIVFISFPEQ